MLMATQLLRPSSGGRGIRTPGGFPHSCFQDNRLRPLGHPSSGISSLGDGILPQVLARAKYLRVANPGWVNDLNVSGYHASE
jgi:hypothetical protein